MKNGEAVLGSQTMTSPVVKGVCKGTLSPYLPSSPSFDLQ